MTFITTVTTKPLDNQVDAFSRLRVSESRNIIDVSHVRDINDREETQRKTDSGLGVWSKPNSCVNLSVSGAGSVIRQSRSRGVYQPGKSLLIAMTGVLNSGGANATGVTTRIGYFDDDDGIYFEYLGNGVAPGTLNIVKLSSSLQAGATISQSTWNLDKMDGTGPSGIIIDPSKAHIFIIDLQWLGVGRVRVGFNVNGYIRYAHEFNHSNIANGVYINTPSLPCRYEISTETALAAGSMMCICYAVTSEGGFDPSGALRVASTNNTMKSVTTAELPFMAIKMNPDFSRIQVRLTDIQAMSVGIKNITIRVYKFRDRLFSAILTTGASWVPVPYGAIQYDISATSMNLTDGHLIAVGYLSKSGAVVLPRFDAAGDNVLMTTNIDGVSDVYLITAIADVAGDNLSCAISWLEFS